MTYRRARGSAASATGISTSRIPKLAGPGPARWWVVAASALAAGVSTPATSNATALGGQRTILPYGLGDRMGDGARVGPGDSGGRHGDGQRRIPGGGVVPHAGGQAERGLRSSYGHRVARGELARNERRGVDVADCVAGVGGGRRRPGPVADIGRGYGLRGCGGAGREIAGCDRRGPGRGELGTVVRHRDTPEPAGDVRAGVAGTDVGGSRHADLEQPDVNGERQ